ncbi:hypothetical protein B0H15DRAFT_803374, partial [Mycena belliarum]
MQTTITLQRDDRTNIASTPAMHSRPSTYSKQLTSHGLLGPDTAECVSEPTSSSDSESESEDGEADTEDEEVEELRKQVFMHKLAIPRQHKGGSPRPEAEDVVYMPTVEQITVELEPFEKWKTRDIPESSEFHKDWHTSDWENWADFMTLGPYPYALNRTQIGILVKEGYKIRGRIRPVAHTSVGPEPELIFTTTFDEQQYYRLKDLRTIVDVGRFASLKDFWSNARDCKGKAMKLDWFSFDNTTLWHHWIITAFVRSGGDLHELHSYMEQEGEAWWDFCARHENLKQIPAVFANVVDAEKKLLADPDKFWELESPASKSGISSGGTAAEPIGESTHQLPNKAHALPVLIVLVALTHYYAGPGPGALAHAPAVHD